MEIVVAVVALTGLIFGLAAWAAARRRKAFRAVAEGMGWSYVEKDPGLTAPFQSFELFRQGSPHPARNVLRGDFGGRPVTVFDYAYTTGSGKNRSTTHQTVVHVEEPALGLPVFSLGPENAMHRLFSVFGYQDIDFPERPLFSKQCLLRGPDEAAIRARFSAPVLEFFEAGPRLCVEGGGPHLLVYRRGRLAKPDALPDLLTAASDVLRTFHATAVIPPPLA